MSRVLVVESDPFVRRFFATMLSASGIRTRETATAAEAREILATDSPFQGLIAEAEEEGPTLLRDFPGAGLLTSRGSLSEAIREEARARGWIVAPKPFGIDPLREFTARFR